MTYEVYLAGPITGQTVDGAKDWREQAAEFLTDFGIKVRSPMRGKQAVERLVGEGVYVDQYREAIFGSDKEIYKRDRWDVKSADLMLANLTEPSVEIVGPDNAEVQIPSIGTCIEFGWADAFGTYTIAAIPEHSVHDHALIRQSSGLVVPTFEEALALVPVVLGV